MRNISGKVCSEKQNKHFTFNNFSKNRAVYDIMWKNIAQSDRRQMTI